MRLRWRSRRRMAPAVAFVAALLLASCTAPSWPQFGRTSEGPSATTATSITSANVGTLLLDFQAALGPNAGGPILAHGRVYIVADDQLKVFDAAGVAGCDDASPRQCQPLWTASVPGTAASAGVGSPVTVPAVGGGVVLVGHNPGSGARLSAFDANGATGCAAGPPVTCQPIWTAPIANTPRFVTIANGFAFGSVLPTGDAFPHVAAFDLAGLDGCSGVPTVCSPVWIGAEWAASPVVAANDGVLVAVGQTSPASGLLAYDPHGLQGCDAASPRVCTALWKTTGPGGFGGGPPAIVGGLVFEHDGVGPKAFATAGTSCPGAPTPTCAPLWSATARDFNGKPVAVGGGRLVATDDRSFGTAHFIALDSAGVEGCSGSPVVCLPLWKGIADMYGQPTIANDLVFVGGGAYRLNPNLAACTTHTPPRCPPAASLPALGQQTIVFGQRVYSVRSTGDPAIGTFSSYRLP